MEISKKKTHLHLVNSQMFPKKSEQRSMSCISLVKSSKKNYAKFKVHGFYFADNDLDHGCWFSYLRITMYSVYIHTYLIHNNIWATLCIYLYLLAFTHYARKKVNLLEKLWEREISWINWQVSPRFPTNSTRLKLYQGW